MSKCQVFYRLPYISNPPTVSCCPRVFPRQFRVTGGPSVAVAPALCRALDYVLSPPWFFVPRIWVAIKGMKY